MNVDHNKNIERQYDLRASTFDESVHWITDHGLIAAHVQAAGDVPGYGLEMCCGTAAVSRGMQDAGWLMVGVDISPGMVRQAQQYIKATVGDVTNLSYVDQSFDAIILRQAYFLLADGPGALAEVKRLLKPGGRFVVSLTVPFGEIDAPRLKQVHTVKQSQLVRFFTADELGQELRDHGFHDLVRYELKVRESITKWLNYAPEMDDVTRGKVSDLVVNAPDEYRNLRRVEVVDGEILEDWNWVVYSAAP